MKANKQNIRRVAATIPSQYYKQVIRVLDCKTVVEPCAPRRYQLTAFIPDLEMLSVSVLTDFIPQGIVELKKEIVRLRREVPVRRKYFARVEQAINDKFLNRIDGFRYLNEIEPEWRAAPTARLKELVQIIEREARQ